MVWIESMMTSRGVSPSDSVAMMSSTDVSAASSTAASVEAKPLRPQPHLRHRLFARNVDGAMPRSGKRCGGLHEERRLADARIAADQQDGAAYEASAGDPIKLGEA